jgi:hypothetical protein
MRPSRVDPCENPEVAAYFDLSTANERLAELRPLLTALREDRDTIARAQQRLERLRGDGKATGAERAAREAVPGGDPAGEATPVEPPTGAAARGDAAALAVEGIVQREQRELVAAVRRMEAAVRQIDAWGITLRDIGSGLVDFPALANGRPIWLCWRLGEGDIAWWHELETGIAGRKPLIDLE